MFGMILAFSVVLLFCFAIMYILQHVLFDDEENNQTYWCMIIENKIKLCYDVWEFASDSVAAAHVTT